MAGLHLGLERVERLGRDALGRASGGVVSQDRVEATGAVGVEPAVELALRVSERVRECAPTACGSALEQAEHLDAVGERGMPVSALHDGEVVGRLSDERGVVETHDGTRWVAPEY